MHTRVSSRIGTTPHSWKVGCMQSFPTRAGRSSTKRWSLRPGLRSWKRISLFLGPLLVRNPYEKARYEYAERSIEQFSIQKYNHLAVVAKFLGARSVEVLSVRDERASDARTMRAKGRFSGASAEAHYAHDVRTFVEDRIAAKYVFPGGRAQAEEASDYLAAHNLSNDHELRALVRLRSGDNVLVNYSLTISATRESEANLRSAMEVANAGPIKAASIGAEFVKKYSSSRNLNIRTEISF